MPSDYKIGESVQARWPGSRTYYPARIINSSQKSNVVDVQFEDGTVHSVTTDTVKIETRRSKSRSKGPSPRRISRGRSSTNKKTPTRSTKTSESGSESPSRSRGRPRKSESGRKSPMPSKANSVGVKKAEPKTPTTKSRTTHTTERVSPVTRPTAIQRFSTTGTRSSPRIAKMVSAVADTKGNETMSSDDEDLVDSARLIMPSKGSPMNNLKASLLIIAGPLLVLYVNVACDRNRCTVLAMPKVPRTLWQAFDLKCVGLCVGWVFFQFVLAALPIGKVAEGYPTPDGTRLRYRLNGIHSFIVSLAVLAGLLYYKQISLDLIFDKYLQLITASILLSFVVTTLLLVKYKLEIRNKNISSGSQGENKKPPSTDLVNFYLGCELNPRIGKIDLKTFFVLRTGLIAWALLNICMVWNDYQNNNKQIYPSLAIVAALQFLYVFDALLFEESILSTFLVANESLGFMLIFGSLTFVPFVFNLAPRFLALYRPPLPYWALVAISIFGIFGYIVFRASNLEKDRFRRNPYLPKFGGMEKIPTVTTKKLLVSGWWGFVRHPNYLGDILMALSWSLPCGFEHILPYTYVIYLTILLIHRTYRDDRVCHMKYGVAADCYRKQVPSRILPGIF